MQRRSANHQLLRQAILVVTALAVISPDRRSPASVDEHPLRKTSSSCDAQFTGSQQMRPESTTEQSRQQEDPEVIERAASLPMAPPGRVSVRSEWWRAASTGSRGRAMGRPNQEATATNGAAGLRWNGRSAVWTERVDGFLSLAVDPLVTQNRRSTSRRESAISATP
jgi:hypothetical protein